MTIPFTHYYLPNGRKETEHAPVSPEIEAVALALRIKGVHFDAEVLSNGMVSLTAEKDDLDDPVLAIKVFAQVSAEQVTAKVEELVNDAATMLAVRTEAL